MHAIPFFTCKPSPGGIPIAKISNKHGSVSISLLGANVIDWTPQGERPVIWLSTDARFIEGKSIRGGIPICWPWFGTHTSQPDYPAHGFARTRLWSISDTTLLDDEVVCVTFSLALEIDDLQWPHTCTVEYRVTLSETLKLELITTNTGDEPFELTQALHTYFKTDDVSQVTVHGLADRHYLDKLEGFAEKQQQGGITFEAETDRIYIDTDDECRIEDRSMSRQISISKSGSQSTVVWNPWQQTADKMGDLGDGSYRGMLCVETGNAGPDHIILKPQATHKLMAIYSCDSIYNPGVLKSADKLA